MSFQNICSSIWRKKTINNSKLHDTKLSRCLGLVDLIGLGIGSSLGLGVYVVTSYAIKNEAGPSYVISVIIAGVAALFAGLCYAEFSTRLPRAGSAYLYSYVTLGEFCGFVVGWNLILEHILTASLAAKAWSQYFDFMLNGTIERSLKEHLEWEGGILTDEHPDVIAFSVLILVTLVIASGARISSTVNLVLVFFNFLIIMCFVCVGYFHVKHENWTSPPGFFAHGFIGVIRGAGSLFFTFANFEAITSGSEESKEPGKHLPTSIMYTVFITFGTYFCVSTATTLSLHNFNSTSTVLRGAGSLFFTFANFEAITSGSEESKEPGKHLPTSIMYTVFITFGTYFCVSTATTLSFHNFNSTTTVTLPTVLQTLDVHGASSVVSVGGLLGLAASAIGAGFYLPRIIYSMSSDGIFFKELSVISERTKTPIYSVLFSGSVSAIIALVSNFDTLLQVTSIGTLLAYTFVAVSVLCLRYQSERVGIVIEYEDPDDLTFVECTDFTYADFHLDGTKNKSSYLQSILSNKHDRNESSKLYHERPSQSNGFYKELLSETRRTVSFDENTKLEINMQDSTTSIPKDSTYKRLDSVVSSTSNGSVSGLFRVPSEIIVEPNESTWRTFSIGLLIYILACVFTVMFTLGLEYLYDLPSMWTFVVIFLLTIIMLMSAVLIAKQPQNTSRLFFQTPYVPFVPLLCIVMNTFLLASLSFGSWVRFLVWTAIGVIFYFLYGFRKSLERQLDEQEVVLYEITDESNTH